MAEHKTKDLLVATEDPQPLLSQVQQCWTANSNTTIPKSVLTPEQEEIAMNLHKDSDIPIENFMLRGSLNTPNNPKFLPRPYESCPVYHDNCGGHECTYRQASDPTSHHEQLHL